jgi:hypothetical protein
VRLASAGSCAPAWVADFISSGQNLPFARFMGTRLKGGKVTVCAIGKHKAIDDDSPMDSEH